MPTISGQGTTFNLPNYRGELLTITPTDTPLLSAIGGLSGGGEITLAKGFEWQFDDLRAPEIRPRLEGAAAPTAEATARFAVDNVVQIFHEAVETSWTKQATIGEYATRNAAPFVTNDGIDNPVTSEHAYQVALTLTKMARDVNYAFWYGKKARPTVISTPRTTGGLFENVTTNVVGNLITGVTTATTVVTTAAAHGLAVNDRVTFRDLGAITALRPDTTYWVVGPVAGTTFSVSATKGGAPITLGTATGVSYYAADTVFTPDLLGELMQRIFESGGISQMGTAALFVSPRQARALSAAYGSAFRQADPLGATRNFAGIAVNTVLTDFGTLSVIVERTLPADCMFVASAEQVKPVFLEIPGKGTLFETELAMVGSSERTQIYGEIGLKWGNERAHGYLRGLAV